MQSALVSFAPTQKLPPLIGGAVKHFFTKFSHTQSAPRGKNINMCFTSNSALPPITYYIYTMVYKQELLFAALINDKCLLLSQPP